MCDPVSAAVIGAAVLGAGTAVYQGNKAEKAQKQATQQAKTAADQQATQADQAFNKANAKAPNVGALDNANAAAGGAGSTLLTGPTGVDPTSLSLGKTTLLGQ